MSDEDRLLPRIGALADAHAAIDLVLMSDGGGVTDLDRYCGATDDELLGVIVSLSNLAAVLARMAAGYANRCAGEQRLSAVVVLESVREAQEIHGARDELTGLDDGMPFDA